MWRPNARCARPFESQSSPPDAAWPLLSQDLREAEATLESLMAEFGESSDKGTKKGAASS